MKRQLSRHSLKYRIAAIIFVLELVMMAAVLGVTLSHSLETSQEHLTESESVIMELLGDLGRIALITSEYDELQPYIEQVTSVPHVTNVFLANREDKVVVSSDVAHIGDDLIPHGSTASSIWRQKDIVNATGKIGTLAIVFSHKDLIEANQASLNLGIQIALTGMVFIALVGIIIGYLLTRRLESLAISAQRLAEGDLDVRTNLKGNDEVAIVGQAFDRMAESIKTYIDNLIDSEEELRKAHNTLEKRVDERTKQLEIATDEAIRANNSKSTFLANISHEIRTPLTAIIGFSDSLRGDSLESQDRKDAINTINNSGKHLLRIINDILDLSKVEADKIELEKIGISPFKIINEVKAITQHHAQQKDLYFSIEYSFPLPETIFNDPVRLKQVLLNLCNNAIKFTSIGGITLKVSCDCVNETMIFKVSDTGIGLDETQMEKIFNAFEQADSTTTRKYGGTGLGLSLSKSLAQLMGGTISVSSTQGVGSCFTLTVASGELDESKFINKLQDFSVEEDPKEHLDKRFTGSVLLVEDNRDNQKLIKLYLKRAGVDVSIASNGQEAVDLTADKQYDLILMDIQMPVMSGIEAVKIIRSRSYNGPIAALTANAMQEGVRSCFDAGCDTFLSKPIDLDEFCAVLNTYLGNPRRMATSPQSPGDVEPVTSTLTSEADGVFDELIEEFVESLPQTLASIRQAFQQQEWQRFSDEVHTLKGTGGNFGFQQITRVCRHIEASIKDDATDSLSQQLDELDKLYARIVTGLETA